MQALADREHDHDDDEDGERRLGRKGELDPADVVQVDEQDGITFPFPNELMSPPAWSVRTERGSGGKYVERSPRTVGH